MGVSLNPKDAVEGGLVPENRNLTWRKPHFTLFEYPARKDGTVVMGKDGTPAKSVSFSVTYVDDDANEYPQNYSVGDPERFTVENGGKMLGPEGVSISKSSNMYFLMSALVSAGFPENRLNEISDDVSQLDGLYALHVSQPEPSRSGLVRVEGQRPRTLSVPSHVIKLPWEGKGKAAPAKGKTAAVPAKEEDAGDAEAGALAMVTEMLADADKVTRQQVATKAIRSKNQPVAKLVFSPKFAEVLTGAGFSLDGEDITAG